MLDGACQRCQGMVGWHDPGPEMGSVPALLRPGRQLKWLLKCIVPGTIWQSTGDNRHGRAGLFLCLDGTPEVMPPRTGGTRHVSVHQC